MKKLLLLAGTAIVLAACTPTKPAPAPLDDTQATKPEAMIEEKKMEPSPVMEESTSAAETMKMYTLAEIAQHNKPTDCWFAVDGAVYDVTPVVASGKHPGGDEILKGCGKDATTLFHTKAGEGKDHSEMAQSNLKNFMIGKLGS